MKSWLEGLLVLLTESSPSEEELKQHMIRAVEALGFEYYHFAYRKLLPISQSRMCWLGNYPISWRRRYAEQGYFRIDPRIRLARTSEELILWSDELFQDTPSLWKECQAHGLRHGITQSVLYNGIGLGILSLARHSPEISEDELANKWEDVRNLACIVRTIYARSSLLNSSASLPRLSGREAEVMR